MWRFRQIFVLNLHLFTQIQLYLLFFFFRILVEYWVFFFSWILDRQFWFISLINFNAFNFLFEFVRFWEIRKSNYLKNQTFLSVISYSWTLNLLKRKKKLFCSWKNNALRWHPSKSYSNTVHFLWNIIGVRTGYYLLFYLYKVCILCVM